MAERVPKYKRLLGLIRVCVHKGNLGRHLPTYASQCGQNGKQRNTVPISGRQLGEFGLSGLLSGPTGSFTRSVTRPVRSIYQAQYGSERSSVVASRLYAVGNNHGTQKLRVELSAQWQRGLPIPSSLLWQPGRAVAALKHGLNSSKARTEVRGRRTYYVDRSGVQHFKRRGPGAWSETLVTHGSMGTIAAVVIGGIVIYVTNLETVPYTHRKHFVLVSPALEKSVGEQGFTTLLAEYKQKLLPANHPETVRVHKISKEIIDALLLGTGASDWGHLEKGGVDSIPTKDLGWANETKEPNQALLGSSLDHTHSHDDRLDEAWVDKSRKEGLKKGDEGYTKHLEGMKWQVVVVDADIMNAVCLPGGKIVVFTGLLNKFRSDPEIATVLSHEVGHAVARHAAETLTQRFLLVAIQLAVLSVFYVPNLVNSVSELLLRLPFSRRMEMEADHIGLILMAAAGYDPRLAPGFYEKMGSLENSPEYAQYLSTHPSGKRRGEKLRNTSTMEEAMSIYREKMAGHGIEGFF